MFRAEPGAVLALARGRGVTLAVAESVTGGAVCAALVSVEGASEVVRGGIVAYTAAAKASVLGVDAALIKADGVVSEGTAVAMAERVRVRFEADVGVATTGVAGPDSHGGEQPGTVWVAVVHPDGTLAHRYSFAGMREQVQARAVDAALALTMEALGGTVLRGRGVVEHN